MDTPIKVLFVDDDKDDFFIVKKYLQKIERSEYIVERAKSYNDAVSIILENRHDVYLVDYGLGAKNGIELLDEIKTISKIKPVIFLTGQKNGNIDIEAMNRGAIDYLIKDQIDPYTLERSIRYSIERKKLEKKLINEKSIMELLLNTTPSSIVLVDGATDEIIKSNHATLDMFGYNENDLIGSNFHEKFVINKYSQNPYQNDFCGIHTCARKKDISSPCPCMDGPMDCMVSSEEKEVGCLVACKSIELINGIRRILRVITMVDTSRQKRAEKKLVETTERLQELIEEYGIEKGDPKAILSLIDIEVSKMKNIEEMASKWNS